MDMPPEYSSSSGRSPRRELQGPRPAPLRVRKDSHKIRKPPMAPPPAGAAAAQPYHQAVAPPRPPVIIYTVSPKIIHANPNEFMSLVQRLTGPNASNYSPSASSSSATSAAAFFQESGGGAISPAARFASIEKTRSPDGRKTIQGFDQIQSIEGMDIGITDNITQRTGQFPGILSPNPNTLPPIPPNFFSPPSDNFNPLSFFHDLSPVLHSSRNYLENNNNNFMLPSPSTNFISPNTNFMPSPNTLDLFHSFFDL